MQYRRLDADGDMLPAIQKYPPLQDSEAVAAAIRTRLLSFYGEWWEDETDGIPVEILFGQMTEDNRVVADALIRDRVAGTEGVNEVLAVEIEDVSAPRQRRIRITVETEFGETITVEV